MELCLRYLYHVQSGASTNPVFGMGFFNSTTAGYWVVNTPVPLRSGWPTLGYNTNLLVYYAGGTTTVATVAVNSSRAKSAFFVSTTSLTGRTAGQGSLLSAPTGTTYYFELDAEL
jgi:hypothetical protein